MSSTDLIRLMSDQGPACSAAATEFASAERDKPEELCRQASVIEGAQLLRQCLDAMPNMVMILNEQRQIVVANEALLGLLGTELPEIIGKRPGEALGCIRATVGPGGCGTSLYCTACGAVQAILESVQERHPVSRECRLLVSGPEGIAALDLKATARLFTVAEDRFILVAVEDISHQKRLAVLQRTCFHDVLNTAGCIHGYLAYMGNAGDQEGIQGQLESLSARLIEEIQAHRDLVYAETGELKTVPEPVDPAETVQALRTQYRRHPVAEGRDIRVGELSTVPVLTDRQLLLRVLGNMLKNALEATPLGGSVVMACRPEGGNVVFSVNNREVMPTEVQLQIFQRSFSTKAAMGRGIGTYSMQLLSERYLRGKVTFRSREPEGTTFELTLPAEANG